MDHRNQTIFKVTKILYVILGIIMVLAISAFFEAFSNEYDRVWKLIILCIGLILLLLGAFLLNFIVRHRLIIRDNVFYYYIGRKENKRIPLDEIIEMIVIGRNIIIKHGRKKTIIPNYFQNVGQLYLLLNKPNG
jgi:hypothetical protein